MAIDAAQPHRPLGKGGTLHCPALLRPQHTRLPSLRTGLLSNSWGNRESYRFDHFDTLFDADEAAAALEAAGIAGRHAVRAAVAEVAPAGP